MDPVTTAALISGGTSLLGGLLGSRRKPVKNRIDFVQMRKDAEKAGISMKAALMGGAASGYNNATGGEPTLGAGIATALGDAVQTGFNERDRLRDDERDNLEREVMRAELDNIKANTQAANGRYFGYGIPNATTTTDNRSDSDFDPTARDDLRLAGVDVSTSEYWSDAEIYEQRWGEVGGALMGLGVMAADGAKTYREQGSAVVRRWGEAVHNRIHPYTRRDPPINRKSPERFSTPTLGSSLPMMAPDYWDPHAATVEPYKPSTMNWFRRDGTFAHGL